MGCGASQVKLKTERSNSQVTIESQQRTVAAYRRQRFARDMEQVASLRAQEEVEKALMLKRSSLGSVDDRRPSYVMRVLEDLAEVEEGQEEVEERYVDPVLLNGTYYNEKLAEQEQNRNERNITLHSSVTQQHSVTHEKELDDDSNLNRHAQNDELVEDQNGNVKKISLHNLVTQDNSVTPEEEQNDNSKLTTHAQNDDENGLDSAKVQNSLFTINETTEKSSLEANTLVQNDEQNLYPISEVETKQEDQREVSGSEGQRDTIFDDTTHVQENTEKTDHNLTNHDREQDETEKNDEMKNKFDLTEENLKDNMYTKERESKVEEKNRLESQRLERRGVQESTDLPEISDQALNS